jgi:hypothetical protein
MLCALLIYNSLGYFLVFTVIRGFIQHKNWEKIETVHEDQLSTFTLNKNSSSLEVINAHEIKVNGKLYDVARSIDYGFTVTYYCVKDNEEQSFLAKTREFNSDAQPVPVKNTAKLIIEKIIKTAFFENTDETLFPENEQSIIHFSGVDYSCPALSILIPPPQPCC